MDRAHRLGQTRTVNVYRLLMRNTLEERVMGLQQFKLDVANAVVNADNVSLGAMDTTQLLDLFSANGQQGQGQAQGQAGAEHLHVCLLNEGQGSRLGWECYSVLSCGVVVSVWWCLCM